MPTSAPTDDEIRTVVELAALAPSVHNTQPWHFRWDGSALDVHEDATRALPVLDPAGRERVLSCGAAVRHAELALAELGWASTTTLLPSGDASVLARIMVGGHRPPTAREHALGTAALRRTTDREPYTASPVPADVLEVLRRDAEAEGAWLRIVDPQRDDAALGVLLARADAVQAADAAYRDELRRWRGEGAVGVPDRALAHDGPRASSLALRDFDVGARARQTEPAGDDPPPAERPLVVVLGTPGDTRRDWLQAGRATASVLLAATVEGVAAQPLTAVVEVASTRARLRTALGMIGQPQLVLRLGYGTCGPATRRLPVEQVLDVSGA